MGDSVIDYSDYPLEFRFAFNFQRVQGLTFYKVILALKLLEERRY